MASLTHDERRVLEAIQDGLPIEAEPYRAVGDAIGMSEEHVIELITSMLASGKIKRGHSHARHILTKKTNKRKRLLDIDGIVADGDQKRVERMLPYGRD